MGNQLVENDFRGPREPFELSFYDAKKQLYTRKITVLGEIGRGSTCICYDVLVGVHDDTEQKMILKQFYPVAFEQETKIEQKGAELFIDGYEHLEKIKTLGKGFEKAFEILNHLTNEEKLMGILVRPVEKYFSEGPTKYVLYEANNGKSMDKLSLGTDIRKLLSIIKEAAKALSRLHEHGILHMDLSPDNILWVDDSKVKFFDFDAVVQMDKLDDVHGIRGKNEFLAPELAPENNFEQNKKMYLKPAVDIYSLGSILFYYIFQRCPAKEEMKQHGYKKELFNIIERNYGKLFNDEKKNLLFQIIKKSIHFYVGKRYVKAMEMAEDIEKLLKVFDDFSEDPGKASEINHTLLAGYILHKYPLFRYAEVFSDAARAMEAVIVGKSVFRDVFVKNIFSCAQMLDTKLTIKIIADDIREYLHDLLISCPALGGTVKIYLEDEPYLHKGKVLELDSSITETEFANIYAYETFDEEKEVCSASKYYLLIDDDYEKNYRRAEVLGKAFVSRKEKDAFIGCAFGREKSDTWQLLKDRYPDIQIERIECNAVYSIVEKQFEESIFKMALGVHTFYTKEWNETASKEEIWKDFKNSRNSYYNMQSSLRSALSIPYKLASCHIIDNIDPAEAFYENVLSGTEEAMKNKNRMIYLEHRSWMCFMITQGYRCPNETELKQYFYKEKDGYRHDHRNMKDKLHPCICGCSSEKGLMLQKLNKKQWKDLSELEKKKYDKLDCLSLKLYRMCRQRAQKVQEDVSKLFQDLEKKLRSSGLDGIFMQECIWLKTLFSKMMEEETNINAVWIKETGKCLKHMEKAGTKELQDILKNICKEMSVIVARNEYHDYKSTDATILDAIPRILMNRPFRRIYKLYSEKNWQNVMSSIILEPEELILITENGADIPEEQKKLLIEFFENRGIRAKKKKDDEKECESGKKQEFTLTVKALEDINIRKNSLKAVVDITGAGERMLFDFMQKKDMRQLPVVYYRNGKLEELSGKGEISFYNQKKSLTVESTFSLAWANVFSFKKDNDMIDLAKNYKALWKAYLRVKPFEWKIFIELIAEWEGKNYWKIEDDLMGLSHQKTRKETCLRALRDCGIDKVLADMKLEGLIKDYQIPDKIGMITVHTENAQIITLIERMLRKIEKEPYQHSFLLQKRVREPISGAFLKKMVYYIKDETDIFSIELKEKIDVIKKVIHSLCTEGKNQKQDMILMKLPESEVITDNKDGSVKLAFRFFNKATKECLLKEGNVLEQYAYHTIVQNTTLSDVKINVEFARNAWNGEDDTNEKSILNEIDLVCCQGVQTFFVSCKQSRPAAHFLNEIKYYADYFGIDAKAIMLCSNNDRNYQEQAEHFVRRSENMGVYVLERSLIGGTKEDVDSGKLAKVIQNIVDGKENWREIE